MELLRRIVTLLPWAACATDAGFVLRHAPTGRVLSGGADGDTPVRFATRSSAGAFCARWLDEADAWEPVAFPGSLDLGQAAA